MSNQTVRVIAQITALPEKVEELKAALLELIQPTRQEAGCIRYELLQNQSDPKDFTFVEEWTSNCSGLQTRSPRPANRGISDPD